MRVVRKGRPREEGSHSAACATGPREEEVESPEQTSPRSVGLEPTQNDWRGSCGTVVQTRSTVYLALTLRAWATRLRDETDPSTCVGGRRPP